MKRTALCFIGAMLIAGHANAQTCTYDVIPPPNVALSTYDALTVTVTAPAGCTWTARAKVPWLAISKTLAGDFNFVGNGNGFFFVLVAPTVAFGRSATVTVNDGSGNMVATFDVSQMGQAPPLAPRPRADFDGDGYTDLTVWRPGPGVWYSLSTFTMLPIAPRPWGLGGLNDQVVSGEYDGDGQEDYAVWRPGDGIWYILQSSTNYTAIRTVHWGQAGDVPVPADYDGDYRTDIGIFRPSTGVWFILKSTFNYTGPSAIVVRQWGSASDRPVPADYDGDGLADMAVWRPSTGTWWILRSWLNYSQVVPFSVNWGLGQVGDVPVPGDYDGDRAADPAVWRRDTGVWYILRSNMQLVTYYAIPWGLGSLDDRPIVGDYNGDGSMDLGIWRGTNGTWFVRSITGFLFYRQWGTSVLNDVPIPR